MTTAPPDALLERAAFALGGLSAALDAAPEAVREGWAHRLRVQAAVGDGDGRLLEARLAGLPIDARLRLDRGALARAEARYRLCAGGEETDADDALRRVAGRAGLAGVAAAVHGWSAAGRDADALLAAVPRALARAFGGPEPAGVVGVAAVPGERREVFVGRFLRAVAAQAAAGREALAALAAARAEAVRRLRERARAPVSPLPEDAVPAGLPAGLLDGEPRPVRRRAPRSDSRALAAIDCVTGRPMGAAGLAAALGLTVRGASALADGLVAVGSLVDLSPLRGRRCYALADRAGVADALRPAAEPSPPPAPPLSPSPAGPEPVPPLDLEGIDGDLRALLRETDAAIGRVRRRLDREGGAGA